MSLVLSSAPDADGLAHEAAVWFLACAELIVDAPIAVCLAGGSTPRALYTLLAQPPYRDALPWGRLHWFFGDERCVPRDDPRSNVRMAREAMLGAAPVPAGNVHAPPESLTPMETAQGYEAMLRAFYGADALDLRRPLFDIMLLGLGADGHTASLFPGEAGMAETEAWVIPVSTKSQPEPRVSLTLPVLDSSRNLAFLVSGAQKRDALARLRAGDRSIPAALVHPAGAVHVFCDQEAQGR